MHINIIQNIRKFIDLNEIEVVVINRYIETHQFKKKEFIQQEHKVCKQLYFVEKAV